MNSQQGPELQTTAPTRGTTPPMSLSGLTVYCFFFILLTLHKPYVFLYLRPNLIITSNGLEYDMGGLFPHLGAAMAVFGVQLFATFAIVIVIGIMQLLFRRINAFSIAFYSICGLQALVYHAIYFSEKNDPAILRAFGPFSISWLFLALFIIGSLRVILARPTGKPDGEQTVQAD